MEVKKRGCGFRKKGGIYIGTEFSEYGYPIEYFLIDPPYIPTWEYKKQGVELIKDESGTYHIIDYVGSGFYPNVSDFIEETKRLGLSRRCEGIDYSLLSPESTWIGIHKKAHISNWEQIFSNSLVADTFKCPKDIPTHNFERLEEMCIGFCWYDVDSQEEGQKELACKEKYFCSKINPQIERNYFPAMFLRLPIHKIEFVKGAKEKKLKKLKEMDLSIPVKEVDF